MTYPELKAAISSWMARSDYIDADLVLFIQLAEARINRELRVRAMETVYFRTLDSDARAEVPADYREFKSVYLYKGTGSDDSLPSLSNTLVSEMTITSSNSLMTEFAGSGTDGSRLARIGNYFYVGGKPVGDYSLGGVMYRDFAALSDVAQTNWLSLKSPDLLLAACLAEASLFIKSPEQAELWGDKSDAIIESIMLEEKRESMSGAKLITRSGVRGA